MLQRAPSRTCQGPETDAGGLALAGSDPSPLLEEMNQRPYRPMCSAHGPAIGGGDLGGGRNWEEGGGGEMSIILPTTEREEIETSHPITHSEEHMQRSAPTPRTSFHVTASRASETERLAPELTATALVSGARWRPVDRICAVRNERRVGRSPSAAPGAGVPGGGAGWTWGLWGGAPPLGVHALLHPFSHIALQSGKLRLRALPPLPR